MKTFSALAAVLALGIATAPAAHATDSMMKKDSMTKHGEKSKMKGKHGGAMMKGDAMQKDTPAQ